MLDFIVNGQRLISACDPGVVADTINYLELKFEFSADWADVIPWAEIIAPDGTKITPIVENGVVSAEKGINLTEGVWTLSVVGDKYEGGEVAKRITTNTVTITVEASGISDGGPFHIDIDAGSEIIARSAAFAAVAEDAIAEAERKIAEAQGQIEEAKRIIRDAEGISEQAAKDAKTALDAAKSVPAAVTNATNAAIQANRAATNANTEATRASQIYGQVKAALDSGALNGRDGYTPVKGVDYLDGKDGKDWVPTDTELNGIAENAAGKLQPSIDAIGNTVALHSTELETQAGDIDTIEADVTGLKNDLAELDEHKVGYSEVVGNQLLMYSDSEKAVLLATMDLPTVDAPVKSVKVAGTALTPDADGAVNVPNANAGVKGVVRASIGGGLEISDGVIYIDYAGNGSIDSRTGQKSIVPLNLDYAVRKSLTDGKNSFTDAEKASACDTIGATADTDDWDIQTITMEEDASLEVKAFSDGTPFKSDTIVINAWYPMDGTATSISGCSFAVFTSEQRRGDKSGVSTYIDAFTFSKVANNSIMLVYTGGFAMISGGWSTNAVRQMCVQNVSANPGTVQFGIENKRYAYGFAINGVLPKGTVLHIKARMVN